MYFRKSTINKISIIRKDIVLAKYWAQVNRVYASMTIESEKPAFDFSHLRGSLFADD